MGVETTGPTTDREEFYKPKRILTTMVSAPQYSLADDVGWIRGQTFSLQTMFPALLDADLTKLGPDLRVPIFFFEGRSDPYCPASVIADYVQSINAPQKELVWSENSGHFPFYEENQQFTDELIRRVLPLVN